MTSLSVSQRLQYCKLCNNRKSSLQAGIVCGFTKEKPDFAEKCERFERDEVAIQKEKAKIQARTEAEDSSGFFGPEKRGMKKGVTGGVLMIVLALVWFFGGLAVGRIFFYPPILLIIGIVAVVRGLSEGNYAGEKYKEVQTNS